MGGGEYSHVRSLSRSTSYKSKSSAEIFSKSRNSAMNPSGVTLREARDSKEHPKSVPIILALDVTGSMGSIPDHLVKEGLPHIMNTIIKAGIAHPQILFMGIGDHECDEAPLQIGQFESSDELLDSWLTKLWLEGGGGGNNGESYLLAWMFASKYTKIDSFEKRKKKGFLFTIGDEPTLKTLPAEAIKDIMGCKDCKLASMSDLLEAAQTMYHVYHLHVKQGHNGRREDVMNGWKEIIRDNLIIVEDRTKIPNTIANIIKKAGKKDKTVEVEEVSIKPKLKIGTPR